MSLFDQTILISEHEGGLSFPVRASEFAANTDWLYNAIMIISIIFFLKIVGVMVYFCWKYRRRPGHKPEPSPSHHLGLELSWTIGPIFLLIGMFIYGAAGYLDMRRPPSQVVEILVTAKKWNWSFTYPNGHVDDVLHLAKGQPVVFRMKSEDVLHSFFIPEFRQKWDVVPGRFTKTWVTPTMTSTMEKPFHLYCAEYCGDEHSKMKKKVVVHDKSWQQVEKDHLFWPYEAKTAVENGERMYKVFGCIGCHSIDGTSKVGPTFKGRYGTNIKVTEGGSQKDQLMDETYIRQSILQPISQVAVGYNPQMPNLFNGRQLTEEEIEWIIAYIRSVNADAKALKKINDEADGRIKSLKADEDQSGESDDQTKEAKASAT